MARVACYSDPASSPTADANVKMTQSITERAMLGLGSDSSFRFCQRVQIHHEKLRIGALTAIAVDTTAVFTHGGATPAAG